MSDPRTKRIRWGSTRLLATLVWLTLLLAPTAALAQQADAPGDQGAPPVEEALAPADDDSADPPAADDDSADPPVADDDSADPPAADDDSAGSGDDDSAAGQEKKKEDKVWWKEFGPIALLLLVIVIVFSRLPKVEGLGHSEAYRLRRLMNWLPLGLTYAFFYMGRYNLKVSKDAFENLDALDGSVLMGNEDFSLIFAIGTAVYGCAFVINGPLTDRIGGKKAMLIGGAGIVVINTVMGLASMCALYERPAGLYTFLAGNFVPVFAVFYGINMYFQSFGAVAIVKVNAPWFHVKERGVFGAIFGILISLGLYFAFDWSSKILGFFERAEGDPFNIGLAFVFFTPAAILFVLWVTDFFMVRDTPGEAGHRDFHTGDASAGDDSPRLSVFQVFRLLLRNPIIVTIACVEFCSGFLRQAIMQYYGIFAKQTDGILHLKSSFVNENWGMMLCCAGILGGVFAGVISDRVFQSRRGPVAVLLYILMFVSAVALSFLFQTWVVGFLVVLMSLAIIGVHGMLSGTASMDFGGAKNAGTAVGVIDGFVYLGTAFMAGTFYFIIPREDGTGLMGDSSNPDNWWLWPVSMIVMALVGTLVATRVWHSKPKSKGGGGH